MSTRIDEALSEIVDIPGKKNDGFHSLVQALSRYLGPSSGLDSADIDPRYLENLMEAYVSQEDEWINYALGDPSRAYTRNLIDRGNGKSNLVCIHVSLFKYETHIDRRQLILVWTPGKSSPIHDHADAHCVMKVSQGSCKGRICIELIEGIFRSSKVLSKRPGMNGLITKRLRMASIPRYMLRKKRCSSKTKSHTCQMEYA